MQAQIYKCKQIDGSTSFQDHACETGTTGKQIDSKTPDSVPASETMQKLGFDSSCQQEANITANKCSSALNDSLQTCWKQKLSLACFNQVSSPPSVKRDDSCIEQAMQCSPEGLEGVKRCVQENSSTKCNQQRLAMQSSIESKQELCAPQFKKWADGMRGCGGQGKSESEQLTCIDKLPKPTCGN